jgi:hypothetical protein
MVTNNDLPLRRASFSFLSNLEVAGGPSTSAGPEGQRAFLIGTTPGKELAALGVASMLTDTARRVMERSAEQAVF